MCLRVRHIVSSPFFEQGSYLRLRVSVTCKKPGENRFKTRSQKKEERMFQGHRTMNISAPPGEHPALCNPPAGNQYEDSLSPRTWCPTQRETEGEEPVFSGEETSKNVVEHITLKQSLNTAHAHALVCMCVASIPHCVWYYGDPHCQ